MIIIAEVSELTRKIKLPTDRVISVNGDYQVDGIAFKLPATYEGDFDFSTAAVRVHWTGVDKVEHTNLITEEDGNGYPLWIMPSELTQGGHGVIEFAVSFIATDETAAVTKRWISDPVSFRNRRTVNGSSEDEAEEEAIYDRLASAIAAVRAAQASVDKVNEVLAGITNSSPVVVATAADLSNLDVTKHQLAIVRADGYLYYYDGSAWQKGIKYGSYELDTTLTESGKAADAAAVGAKISQIKEDLTQMQEEINSFEGITEEVKQALLQIARKVAYIDEHGQTYYNALYDALYAITAVMVSPRSISLSAIGQTSQLTAQTTPAGGAVTWGSSNPSVATVDQNGLVTATGLGSATITATSGGKSGTCSVLVAEATLTEISAVYTPSGTVYESDSLDSLKSNLVVTAYWSNGTTSEVASADYTLSGTLAEGTSVVTVSYGGKTATFSVTVTDQMLGYVDTGLIMLLDGIANGARGAHNSTITSLYDNSGNDHGWEASTATVTATEKALVFDGTADLAPTWTSGLENIETVEVVLDVTNPSTTQCLLAGIGYADSYQNDTAIGSLGVKSGNMLHRTGSTDGCIPITSGRHTYTFVKNGTSWKGYKDGAEVSFGSATISWKSGYKRLGSFIGQNQDTHSYFFTGSLYSLRYYSTALSVSDIASNYANDTERFA